MTDAAKPALPMNATRRAWLRELGVERIWSGGSVASAPAPAPEVESASARTPELEKAPAGTAEVLHLEAAEVASKQVALPVIASEVVTEVPELAAKPAVDEEQAWTILQEEIRGCVACGLCKGRTQTVFGTGVRRARWMVIGEAPGEQEDRQGVPFVGRSGKLLDSMLAAVGRSRHEDVFIANVIKCRPPGNRDPLPEEVASCSPYLMRQITLVQPEMILVVGRFAAQTLLGTDAKIGSLRGQRHEVTVDGRKIPVVVSYHPAYLLRSPQEKTKAWQDLRLAVTVGKAIAA